MVSGVGGVWLLGRLVWGVRRGCVVRLMSGRSSSGCWRVRRVWMPAKSQAQRKFLYAKFGARWVQKHHFDNPGKLPKRVKKG